MKPREGVQLGSYVESEGTALFQLTKIRKWGQVIYVRWCCQPHWLVCPANSLNAFDHAACTTASKQLTCPYPILLHFAQRLYGLTIGLYQKRIGILESVCRLIERMSAEANKAVKSSGKHAQKLPRPVPEVCRERPRPPVAVHLPDGRRQARVEAGRGEWEQTLRRVGEGRECN